jgi:hypothetical protein
MERLSIEKCRQIDVNKHSKGGENKGEACERKNSWLSPYIDTKDAQ